MILIKEAVFSGGDRGEGFGMLLIEEMGFGVVCMDEKWLVK